MPKTVNIYGRDYAPQVGSFIIKEGKLVGELLTPGDPAVDSSYPGSDFRMPTGDKLIKSLPVNIELTGWTKQRMQGKYFIKCRIEYVGDGEPSTFGSGWMLAE